MSPSSDPLEVTIDSLAFGGDGVARIEGKACFVPFTLPGERCRIRIVKEKKSFSRAELVEVLDASGDRTEPVCPVFGKCGGCQYQHLTYDAECRYKEQQVRELFSRLGGMENPPIQPILPSPEPYGYRNRIQVHIEKGRVGFIGCDGRTHVPVEQCPIADADISRQLKEWSRKPKAGKGRVTLISKGIAQGGFSQINGPLAGTLRDVVAKAVGQFQARHLIEFYAGAGFFTEPLMDNHESVTAVEWDRRLVERGRKAVPAAQWLEMGVDPALDHLPQESVNSETVVLLDPPRDGLSGPLKEWLNKVDACGVVYLSCNPATLARDLKELSDVWQVESIQPIDLFPRTAHIESLAVCRRV